MFQNLLDPSTVFDAAVRRFGNDFNVSTAAFTLLDINIEDAFEPLHPGHRIAALLNGFFLCARHFCRLSSFAAFPRRDQGAMLTVRREKAVEARQIHSWFGMRPARSGQQGVQ